MFYFMRNFQIFHHLAVGVAREKERNSRCNVKIWSFRKLGKFTGLMECESVIPVWFVERIEEAKVKSTKPNNQNNYLHRSL